MTNPNLDRVKELSKQLDKLRIQRAEMQYDHAREIGDHQASVE